MTKVRSSKAVAARLPELPAGSVADSELIEAAFAQIRAAFLPQIEALRDPPGSGSGTITKGMNVCGDYVQVTIHAAKSH